MANATLRKQAVDSVAASYWEEYYKDSGYGKLWTRNIPMRLKAELAKASKTASAKSAATEPVELRPLATVWNDEGVSLEGIAVYAGAGADAPRTMKAFSVEFDHEGAVRSIDVIDLG